MVEDVVGGEGRKVCGVQRDGISNQDCGPLSSLFLCLIRFRENGKSLGAEGESGG